MRLSGDDPVDLIRHHRRDLIGAWLVAVAAFFAYLQLGGPAPGVDLASSLATVLSHGFAAGWSWGSAIVSSYGPLGFLTPYFGWSADSASAFRIGQIVLCGIWALMMFAVARRLIWWQQLVVVAALLVWYPLLMIDIGWSAPFAFAILLVHEVLNDVVVNRTRRAGLTAMIVLLILLALINYTALLMWSVVGIYAVVASLFRRDFRLAAAFGVGMPILFVVVWIGIGQPIGALGDYIAGAAEIRRGAGSMSLAPAPYVDAIGVVVMLLVVATLGGFSWTSRSRVGAALAGLAWAGLAWLAWRTNIIRADQHVAVFFGSAFFIALAVLLLQPHHTRRPAMLRWLSAFTMALCVIVCYGKLGVNWSLHAFPVAIGGLMHPDQLLVERTGQASSQAELNQLPRTRARSGSSKIDVLMNEASIALVNDLNYRPRPTFQGYAAQTPALTRRNEAYLLNSTTAPEYVLIKLQSFDNRLPTGDDPSSVLAALRAYIPVDREGGYLVMKRAGWELAPVAVPAAAQWKQAGLGADLDIDQGPRSKVLFFDVRLNFWGRIRAAIFREPGLSMTARLTDGSEQSFSLVRQMGPAGMLISPLVLSEYEYLRWHAAIFERRIVSLQLRATDLAEVRWFDPIFAYAIAPIDLPRRDRASLTPELKSVLYPGISPAPVAVESPSEQVIEEGGRSVLFVHAPSSLNFDLGPGEWAAKGEFGLASTAYDCAASDGIALVVERLSSNGSVKRLFEKAIDPVHNMTERGAQPFTLEPFEMDAGDSLVLRGAPGLNEDAKSDCDWMFLGPVDFEIGEAGANAR